MRHTGPIFPFLLSHARRTAFLLLLFFLGVAVLDHAFAHPPSEHRATPQAEATPDHDGAPAAGDRHMAAAMAVQENEHDGASEHDHAAHEHGSWAKTGFQRFLAWLGAFHPAATNFPIALLLFAALAELLYAARGKESDRVSARFCLRAGALTAVATAVLGWFYAGFDLAADDPLLGAHRWNGSAVALLALVSLWLGERHWRGSGGPGAYRASLFLVAILAGINGYLGGRMLYGADHYDWPKTETGAHRHDETTAANGHGAPDDAGSLHSHN